jgi:protease IV
MNRELKKLAKKKPVVVSIGDVAASGGYYIAVAGDRIFISPGSVTGSIGIWFGKVVITELLDRLGITRTTFERGKNASLMSTDRKLTAEELEGVRERLQVYYDVFVERVAEGRNKKAAEVEELAQGRVWSGSRALESGLADESGGSYEALQYLKAQAGIASTRPVTLVHYPRKSMSEALAASLTGASAQGGLADTFEQIALGIMGTHLWAVDPWLLD